MKYLYVLLALFFAEIILLYKVYHSIPVQELKRRARAKDKKAASLYRVAAHGATLEVLLWLMGTAAGATLFIWSARTKWWLAAIVAVITAWLVAWVRLAADGWAGSLAAFLAPLHVRIVSFTEPVLGRVSGWLPPGRRVHLHSGLYEKKDLLELLNKQNKQIDNRIPETDLNIAFNAIQFGDKTVAQVMTPRRKVKLVTADETAGPILTDELHKSGFSRFPVVKDSAKTTSPQVIGTLYLSDLIGYEGSGKVKDLAKREVYFINEESNLRQALNAFLKTHHHLLIVVNSFEEMVGVLTLEDVLEQIIGQQILDEFDNYESLRAVAAHNVKKEQAEHAEVKPEQTAETVVE